MSDNKLVQLSYGARVLNPENKEIDQDYIERVFKKYGVDGIKIRDLEIYRQAFVHESYVKPSEKTLEKELMITEDEVEAMIKRAGEAAKGITVDWEAKREKDQVAWLEDFLGKMGWVELKERSYDAPLEFLGDRVLDLIVADYLTERYPDESDQFFTEVKAKLVRSSNLCRFSKKLKFGQFTLVGARSGDFRYSDDVLEDVFEAFLGAMYHDGGRNGEAFSHCRKFVFELFERYINLSEVIRRQENYKKILLEYYHSLYKKDPRYTTISTNGPTNNRLFKAGVKNIDGYVFATGEGKKLVDAEQEAAKNALKYHGVDVYSDGEEEPDRVVYSDSESEEL